MESKRHYLTIVIYLTIAVKTEYVDGQYSFLSNYFQYRQITLLNLLLCNEEAGVLIRRDKSFNNFMFSAHVKRSFDWNSLHWNNDFRKPIGFYTDLECDTNVNLLKQAPNSMFIEGCVWLMSGQLDSFINLAPTINIGLSSDIRLILPNQTVYDAYKYHTSSVLKLVQCGEDAISKCPSTSDRYNLEGTTLKGSIVNYLGLNDDEEGRKTFDLVTRNVSYKQKNEQFIRKFYILNEIISHVYNFNIHLVFSETFGYKAPNGSFNGMIRDFELGKMDYGLTPLSILHERIDIVDFTVASDSICFVYIFLEERTLGGSLALAVPFAREVWLVVASVGILAFLVYIFVLYFYNPENIISQSLLNVVGIVSAQGALSDIKVTSSRVLNLSLLVLGILLSSYYNASIMNGLLSPTPVTIRNVKDLLKSKSVVLANNTYVKPVFFSPELLDKLRHQKSMPYTEIPEGIVKMQHENFALVGDGKDVYEELNQMLTDSEKCDRREIDMQKPFPLSCPVAKNSHFRELFKQGFCRLHENGVSQRESKYWYPPPPACLGGSVFMPVGIKAITIAFYIYATGFMTSIWLFFLEVLIDRKKKLTTLSVLPKDFRKKNSNKTLIK